MLNNLTRRKFAQIIISPRNSVGNCLFNATNISVGRNRAMYKLFIFLIELARTIYFSPKSTVLTCSTFLFLSSAAADLSSAAANVSPAAANVSSTAANVSSAGAETSVSAADANHRKSARVGRKPTKWFSFLEMIK